MKPTRGKTPKKAPRRPNQSKAKDPVEVYSRVRPLESTDIPWCLKITGPSTVQLSPPENSQAYKNGQYKESTHTFKTVFGPETSQKAIFDHIALPLVEGLLRGENGLLFMYGITSSGKTHTMQGTAQDSGILPRSLDVLFNSLGNLQAKKYVFKPDRANGMDVQTEADAMMERQKKELLPIVQPRPPGTPRRKDKEDFSNIIRVPDTTRVGGVVEDNVYSVFVSYVEIYNNYIYDLLEELPDTTPTKSLPSKSLREDSNHNMYVANCNEVEVKNADEAFAVFLRGQKQRKVAHTKLNTESSRSHSVFNVRLAQAPLDPAGEEVLQEKSAICLSQLALVDLAGSERTGRTKTTGDRLREAGNINASLMTLRTCIEILRDNQTMGANKIVPYRDSKVTHLFKNYFDGEGKVRMVVCVNPKAADYDETTHVMRFAEVTQEVQVTRATAPKIETFTPGRRKAHQMYRKMLEQEGTPRLSTHPPPAVISLGPPFPSLQMRDPNEDVISNLLSFLDEREKRRNILNSERERKEAAFRARLEEIELEMEADKKKIQEQQKEIDKYRRRMRSLDSDKQNSSRNHDEACRVMQLEIDNKENKLQKEMLEKDKLRLALRGVQQSEKERWEKEMDKRIKAVRMEYENKLWVKSAQLDQLKQIVCGSGKGDVTELPSMLPDEVTVDEAEKVVAASKPAALNRSQSPPPKRTAPPVKIRHRRSRSTSNSVWVDHKPATTLDTETILQPVGKRKTVNTPSVKDLKNTDNYMVTHQEEDSQGEVETKIYKAEVLPTRGGGRAVQFTDVEQLKTGSPSNSPTGMTGRKRKSDEGRGDTRSKQDVEARCSYGYESKVGQSQPSVNHTVPSKKYKK